jgi:nucleotide-binding universal stress UspA family protein
MGNQEQWLKERLHNIIVATDFHQNSRTALGYASGLANEFGSKLSILHAFEFGPYSKTVEVLDNIPSMERRIAAESLKEFVAQAGAPVVGAEQVTVEGTIPSAIIKTLLKVEADLLVIGTQGVHRGLDHLLLGSNSEALMLGSPCPTLTVGPRVPQTVEPQMTCRKLIHISDLSIASTSAAMFANRLGQAFHAETDVYQLVSKATAQDAPKLLEAAAQYCDILRFVDPELPREWFDPDFQLSRAVPEEEVMAQVSAQSNLIVLGVQPASFLQRHLHASLAYRILTNAGSPVAHRRRKFLLPTL